MLHLRHFFLPYPQNNHRAYLLQHPYLSLFFTALFSFQVFLNLNYSTHPQVLGFATSIYQQELIEFINKERAQAGLAPLQENTTLNKAAVLKGSDMFTYGYWAHVSPSGVTPWVWFEKEGYSYLMAGENLAKDFNTSAGTVAGWMASPTHRDNILNPEFTEIGIAVANGTLLGEETTLVVQFFGKPQPSALADSTGSLIGQVQAQTSQPLPESVTAVIKEKGQLEPMGLPAQTFSAKERLQLVLQQATNLPAWGLGQKVLSLALAGLMLLLLLDSAVHLKNRKVRLSSHSLLHAGVLLVLILAVIYSNFGLVL